MAPLFSSPGYPNEDHLPRTCRPSSRDTFKRVMSGKLSMRVAILNASWASLKMWDEEWMFFWIDSNTVSSLRTSPAMNKGNQSTSKWSKTNQTENHTNTYTHIHGSKRGNKTKHKAQVNLPQMLIGGTDVTTKCLSYCNVYESRLHKKETLRHSLND